MISQPLRIPALIFAAQLLLACSGSDSGLDTPPNRESDVHGIWRTRIQFGSATINATMDIKPDHSLTFSRTWKGGMAADTSLEYENVREEGTWLVENGLMKVTKVACKYADSTGTLASAPCQAPIRKEVALSISGSQWTILEGEATYTFIKD